MDKNKITTETEPRFDAVQMMREIREALSVRYWKHPDILKKDMEEIRRKYNLIVTTSEKN